MPISHQESGVEWSESLHDREDIDLTQAGRPPVRFRWQVKIVTLAIMIVGGLVL